MGFRRTRQQADGVADASRRQASVERSTPSQARHGGQRQSAAPRSIEATEVHYGMSIPDRRTLQRLQTHESTFGERRVKEWVDEGMPTDIMGKTRDMEAFRERQADRPPEVPTDIERRNRRSVMRSEQAASGSTHAGETDVPESVRDVIASTGRSLDASIQRAMEDRMGDSLGDVRIHTGPQAAAACESINARAFTVGNHVAFNQGEYDPESPEGQHVLAHELAHVRQQTQGAVSMLPQDDVELEVDPDPALEREAEETAQRVMAGGELGIQRLADTDLHIQRYVGSRDVDLAAQEESMETAKEMLKAASKESVKRVVPNELMAALEVARENTRDGPPPELVGTVASEVMDRISQQTELDLDTSGDDTKF